jgi:hypothetical protein
MGNGGRAQYISIGWITAFFAVSGAACGLESAGTLGNAPSGDAIDAGGANNDASVALGNPRPDAAVHGEPDAAPIDAGPPLCDGGMPRAEPSGVTFGAPTASGDPIGGGGGFPFDDTCPPGTALAGLSVVTANVSPYSILQIQGLCAQIVRNVCAIDVGSPAPMDPHGMSAGAAKTLACPPGTVVVGTRAASGLFIDSIGIDCAPLAQIGGTWSRGAITSLAPVGGTGGAPSPPFVCPAPMVANELAGSAGAFLNQVQIGCASPSAP